MQCATRPRITELNPHLLCVLCEGYLIDATAITECLHAFCKKCIVQYLETKKYCPVCDVLVHKTKPLQNIKPDKILQSIVYKSVPELYESEMCNRRKFYANVHPQQRPENPELRGEITEASEFYTAKDTISLSLEYINFLGDQNYFYVASSSKRYLRCDAKVTVKLLQKLMSAKYGLATKHEIRFFFNGIQLPEDLTLLDIAYISSWKRNGFIRLLYQILEVRKTVVKVENKAPIITPKIVQNEDTPPPVDKLPLEAINRVNNICEPAKESYLSTSAATATTPVVTTAAAANPTEEPSIAKAPKIEPDQLPVASDSSTVVNNAPVTTATSISTPTTTSNACKSNENSVLSKIVEKLEKKASTGNSVAVVAATKPDEKPNQLVAANNDKENSEKTSSNFETPPPKSAAPITSVSIAPTPVSSSLKKKSPQDCHIPTKIPRITHSEAPKSRVEICKEVESINTPIMSVNSTASSITSASMKLIPTNPITPTYYSPSNKLASLPALRKLPMCYPAARANSCETSKPVAFATTTSSIRKPVAEVRTFTRPWTCTTTSTVVAPVKPTQASEVSKGSQEPKPVKFHKARRNVPRFLGNPASGIRPMYQMNPSSANSTQDGKSDAANESPIKKLPKSISLLKVDPKTLAPICSSSPSSPKSAGTGVNSNKKPYYGSKLYTTMPEYPCSVTNTPNFVGSLPSSSITSSAVMAAAAAAAAGGKLPSPGGFPSPYTNMAHNSLLNPLLYGLYPSHFPPPPAGDSTMNGPTSLDYIKAMAAFHTPFSPPISSLYGPQHHHKTKHDKLKTTSKPASSPPAIQRIPPTSKTPTTSEAASVETSKPSPVSSAPSSVSNGVYKSKIKKEISSFAINNLIPIDEAKNVSHSCSADGVHQVCDQVSPTASSESVPKTAEELDGRSNAIKIERSDEKKDTTDEKTTSK